MGRGSSGAGRAARGASGRAVPFGERGVAEAQDILGDARAADNLARFVRGVDLETAFEPTAQQTLRRIRDREAGGRSALGFNLQTAAGVAGRSLTDAQLLRVIEGAQRGR